MPTTFANTINGNEILAKRSQCDYAGNDLALTYATKAEVTTGLASKEDASNKAQTLDPSSTTSFPSSAATANYVNSSVATATANFLGNFTLADLGLTYPATDAQIGAALDAHTWPAGVTPTNNDYTYIEIENPQTTGIDDSVERFKFNGTNWVYEYTLNNSSFTAAEKAAIDSGIDSAKVAVYDAHVANSDIHVTLSDKSSWNAKQDAISDLSTIRSGASAGATAVQPGDLATVATTGDYSDLSNKPDLSVYAESADLATVATTGAYSDLSGTPTIPTATSDLTNDSGFITLSDVPAQVNADWNSSSGASEILNKPTIPSGTQLVPAATSADADKVLTVDAQGTPAWETPASPESDIFIATFGTTKASEIIAAKTAEKVVMCIYYNRPYMLEWTGTQNGSNVAWFSILALDEANLQSPRARYLRVVDNATLPDVYPPSWSTYYFDLATQDQLAGLKQVPAVTSSDKGKVLKASYSGGTGSYTWDRPIFVAIYGSTTYQAVLDAISAGSLVFCQIDNSPTTYRRAVLSYVDSGLGKVEFLYYRSVGTHSASQQGDQAIIYMVDSTNSWTTTTREAYTAIAAGTHMSQSYNNGTLTLNAAWPTVDQTYSAASTNAQSGTAVAGAIAGVEQVPTVTSNDNNKVLKASYSGGVGSYSWQTESGGGGGGDGADWAAEQGEPGYIENKPVPKTLTGGTGISITESPSTITVSCNVTAPVQDVTVDGTSVVSNGVAAITMPTPPTVDQTYDGTSTNAQSGVAVAEAISAAVIPISVVSTLPASPDPNTLYVVTGV